MASSDGSPSSRHISLRIDRGYALRSWPEAAHELLGWTAAEALGKNLFELLGLLPQSAADARDWEPARFVAVQRHRDGTAVEVIVSFEPNVAADGLDGRDGRDGHAPRDGADGVAARRTPHFVSNDQAADLASTPANGVDFAELVATLPHGVVAYDAHGAIVHANAAAQRLLGLTAEALRDAGPFADAARALQADGSPFAADLHPVAITLRAGRSCDGVVMGVHRPDGSLVWLRVDAQLHRRSHSASHSPPAAPPEVAAVATFVDITAERRLLAEARKNAEQFAAVLEGANDGFWDWDIPSGHVTYSPRWASMLGYDLGELQPHLGTWERLVHPDDLPRAREALRAHLDGDAPSYEVEFRMRHKRGDWAWILDRGKVVSRAPDGTALRAAGTHVDITARRLGEARLRESLATNDRLVAELRAALDRVKALSGLLPVCAWCKSVRNERGAWQRLEDYLAEHTDARATHGLCPTCSTEMKP